MLEIDDLLAKFSKARKAGAGRWTAHCPAHDDTTPSLSISRGDDGRWLLHCHAGCELEAVLLAVNLETRDLFPKTNGHQRAPVIAEYDYTDEQGALLFQVVRHLPKEFRQRRPDGRGGGRGT